MKEQTIINGNLVNYYKFTENKGTNLVFLHGWRSNAMVWNQVIEFFKKENVGIFALDLPGFGDSAVPKKAFKVGDYANTVAEFIKKKNLKGVTVVGHSVGGRITIKLAAIYPELVNKVVLVDSAGFVDVTENKRKIFNLIAKSVKPLFKPKFMQKTRKKIYQVIGSEDYVETPELNATYLNIVKEDLSGYLPQIKQPTLLIWGDQDKDTPLSFGEKMNQNIKNSTLKVLIGAGHFSFIDKTDEFNQLLADFVGRK